MFKYRTLRTSSLAVLTGTVPVRKHLSALLTHAEHGMNEMKSMGRHSREREADVVPE